MSHTQTIALICVPFGLGGRRKGAEFGPEAILKAGLQRHLKELGKEIAGSITIPVPETAAAYIDGELKFMPEVTEVNTALAEQVSLAYKAGQFPLVLGGDHSIAIGTIAGLGQHYNNLGVLWFDAHSDMHTHDTSMTRNIHGISLAISLGRGDERLTGIGRTGAKIKPEHVVIIGARDLDEGEKELIRELKVTCFTMYDIDRMGMSKVVEEALHIVGAGTDGVHLSFDMDILDPLEAPGTGTPVVGGVHYREAHLALEMLAESGLITSAEFVEMNPLLDHNNQTARLAVGLIDSLMGKKII